MKKKMFKVRKKKNTDELDITSLLDILVILLVFLLQNYSASELKIEPVKGLELSNSNSRDMGKLLPTLQMDSALNLWHKNEIVSAYPWDMSKLHALHAKWELDRKPASTQKEKEQKKSINLFIDQEVDYEKTKKLMNAVTELGFEELRLIVKSEE